MNDLQKIVREIQYRTNKTLDEIAVDIDYRRAYFNDQVNKGDNDSIKALLLKKYRKHLKDYFGDTESEDNILQEDDPGFGLPVTDKRVIDMLASKQRTIEILARQVEKMQDKITDLESGGGGGKAERRSG